jgi:hypothetical protein
MANKNKQKKENEKLVFHGANFDSFKIKFLILIVISPPPSPGC